MADLKISNNVIDGVDLVIFDKDGTLMDLYNYWSNMVGYRVELARSRFGFNEENKKFIMYAMGVDLAKGRLREDGPVGIKKREVVLQAMVDALAKLGFPDTKQDCFEIFREADRMSLARLPEIIKPIDGMKGLISDLRRKGCKIAIATTDKTERAMIAADILGISKEIDLIIGEDRVKNYKPHPDMIDLIIRELKVDKKNTVMVGDAITDVEMGINARIKASIGVCSGLTTRERFLNKTKYIAEDVSCIKVI